MLTRYADAFVDDTALWANSIADPYELAQRLQQDLTKYQEMLTWTGGALTLEKCFFSILEWKFTPDGTPYLYDRPHRLAIPRNKPERLQIQQLVGEVQQHGTNPLLIHELEQLTGKKFPNSENSSTQQEYLDQCGNSVEIPQKGSTDTQLYLGLMMTPAGITTAAETLFHKRNQQFGIKMVGSQLQPPEVKLAYRVVQVPSQQY